MGNLIKKFIENYKFIKFRNSYLDEDTSVDFGKLRANIVGAISRLPFQNKTEELKELSDHLNYSLSIVDRVIKQEATQYRWYKLAPYHIFGTRNSDGSK